MNMRSQTGAIIIIAVFIVGLVASITWAEEITVTTPGGTEHQMVFVPSGEFEMGSDIGEPSEKPPHQVLINSYYIDKYEVTRGQWDAFAEATGRTPWNQLASTTRPHVNATWADGQAYCEWAGLRLPTEAEWEMAARGTDGRDYPWGEGIDQTKAAYGEWVSVQKVGSYPDGVSPYGAFEMAGNVWEWVGGLATDYTPTPKVNPLGAIEGDLNSLRGGSSHSAPAALRSSFRLLADTGSSAYTGFRCGRDDPAPTTRYPLMRAGDLEGVFVAGRTSTLRATITLDAPLAQTERFTGFELGLNQIGIDNQEFEPVEGSQFVASLSVTPLKSGRAILPILAITEQDERYELGYVPIEIWPSGPTDIYADAPGVQWSLTERGMEAVEMSQSTVVGHGEAACALTGKASFSGWQAGFETEDPVHPFGHTLRFSFHPGDIQTAGKRFSLSLLPKGTVNLLKNGVIDTTSRQWQTVEIDLTALELDQPITAFTLAGNFAGTFYLDDIQLVAAQAPAMPTAVMEERIAGTPERFSLAQNYPNPFNSGTLISFQLSASDHIDLSLFNLAGQRVMQLAEGPRAAGIYNLNWDGRDHLGREMASGTYFYRLRTGEGVDVRRLLLLR